MRVAFSRAKEVTPEWQENKKLPEDQQLRFSYKPLDYADFTDAAEMFARLVRQQSGDTTVDPDTEVGRELFGLYKRLLPAHVTSVGAPLLPNENDKEQKPVTVEEIATLQPFALLATELLATLISISAPTEADIKN